MSEVKVARNWDFAWFLASRVGALAVAVGLLLVVVGDSRHEEVSQAQAIAVHRADQASRLRKPGRPVPVQVPAGDRAE